jgi:hypothetical protein
MTVEPWWETISGPDLAQGDYLEDCVVPIMPADFTPDSEGEEGETVAFEGDIFDLIIVTQSCDLENKKVDLVAACPVYSLEVYESVNPGMKKHWESVRQGRREGLHLLAAIEDPQKNREALVVDFRQIYSLPVGYLQTHAASASSRMRLRSPYLEHFSQGFARFFMRVGLPCSIPAYK